MSILKRGNRKEIRKSFRRKLKIIIVLIVCALLLLFLAAVIYERISMRGNVVFGGVIIGEDISVGKGEISITGYAPLGTGTIYFIDWSSGSDSNSGTSKSSPWKRHPFMKGYSGSYTHKAGDQFIFRGGVIWPNSAFQMRISQGGSSDSNRDYYGVDKTWYSGSSWSRPVFDFENNLVAPSDAGGNALSGILIEASYITVDNLELKRHIVPSGSWNPVNIRVIQASNGVIIENSYIRDWTQTNPSADNGEGGGISSESTSITIRNNILTQTGISARTGGAIDAVGDIYGNEIYEVPNAIKGGKLIHDNYIHDTADSSGPGHENAIFFNRPGRVYNNLLKNTEASTGIYLWGGADQSASWLIYNNVLYNLHDGITVDGAYVPDGSQQQVKIYSNTFEYSNIVRVQSYSSSGNGCLGLLDIRNNQLIEGSELIYNSGACITNQTASNNIIMSSATATTEGYTAANNYAPTKNTGATVNTGVSLSEIFTTDKLRATRPYGSAWDIGAYEYGGTPGVVNGICGGILNTCTTGILSDIADSGTQYLWNCQGISGGTTALCSLPISVQQYTLTVTTSGSGIVAGTGINCGSDCSESYNSGTSVTLTATASSGSTFSGWGGACSGTGSTCTVTMNAAKSVTATFNVQQASGISWYVDNSVGSSGDGTSWSKAWKNFANIEWTKISAGDTLYISGGTTSKTYSETLKIGASGSVGKPIYIRPGAAEANPSSAHSGTVIIDGGSNTRDGISYKGKNYITIDGSDSSLARKIKIQNVADFGVIGIETIYLTVRYLYVDNFLGYGITARANGDIANNNYIIFEHNIVRNGLGAAGIQISSLLGSAIGSNTIRYNDVEVAHTDGLVCGKGCGVDFYGNRVVLTATSKDTTHPDGIVTYGDNVRVFQNEIIGFYQGIDIDAVHSIITNASVWGNVIIYNGGEATNGLVIEVENYDVTNVKFWSNTVIGF
ncbi:hypothetical protein HYW75_03645, partial [Candidatus Pacearchaeota archaeon]|nr:hypothetical protein [Candidatus Pacearchaeota archaeon]